MEGRDYYAAAMESPIFVTSVGRSLHFVDGNDLTRKKVLYTEITDRVVFDHEGGAWMGDELV